VTEDFLLFLQLGLLLLGLLAVAVGRARGGQDRDGAGR
jgi:hypothetical protein